MWTLSAFADEISPDLEAQCQLLQQLGVRYLEFRSAWDTNILDLDDAQLATARDILQRHGIRVSSIGSPVGKIFIDEDFDAHLVRARRAVHAAEVLEAPYIRVFSFFMREGMNPDDHRDEVLRRMRALADLAESGSVTMLHENEKDLFGDIPRRCADLLASVDSPNLRAAWDPANFVQVGVRPFDEGWSLIRPYLAYMHVKDAIAGSGEVVPAGRGDGQWRETIAALRADGFDGFLSLEPHLGSAHALGGFSGPELFTQAHAVFTDLLKAEGISYA